MNARAIARQARWLRVLLNLYPPFLGAGIGVSSISPDFRQVRVRMALRWYNRNYVRTHFGGSLYAMTDPFFMLMLMANLGRDYLVWDKAAAIDFVKPGRGTVYAEFRLDQAQIEAIRRHTAGGDKYLPRLAVDIRDADGELVARVDKTLYVRLKPHARPLRKETCKPI